MVELLELSISLEPAALASARAELLARNPGDESGFRWGYLLGVDNAAMSSVAALDTTLREAVAAYGSGLDRTYELSFFKAAAGAPPPRSEGVHFDGFHLDTHPEVTGEGDAELARVLINLATTPRRFRYALTDRFELARLGRGVARSDYQVVALPPEIEVRVIEIPPPQPDRVFALAFWASVIPHVGVDGPDGYFLASYEAVGELTPGSPHRDRRHR
jgi:hypothetical protein